MVSLFSFLYLRAFANISGVSFLNSPAENGKDLDCCDGGNVPDKPRQASCSKNPKCEAKGVEGFCCVSRSYLPRTLDEQKGASNHSLLAALIDFSTTCFILNLGAQPTATDVFLDCCPEAELYEQGIDFDGVVVQDSYELATLGGYEETTEESLLSDSSGAETEAKGYYPLLLYGTGWLLGVLCL